jgi:hypothetical protein
MTTTLEGQPEGDATQPSVVQVTRAPTIVVRVKNARAAIVGRVLNAPESLLRLNQPAVPDAAGLARRMLVTNNQTPVIVTGVAARPHPTASVLGSCHHAMMMSHQLTLAVHVEAKVAASVENNEGAR